MSKEKETDKLSRYESIIKDISVAMNNSKLSAQEVIDVYSLLLIGNLAVINPDEAIKLADVLQHIMSAFPAESRTTQIDEQKEEAALLAKVSFRRKSIGLAKDFWGLDPILMTSNH
jgi:hypothetical protein